VYGVERPPEGQRSQICLACAALVIANLFNIGADLRGIADAAEMLTGLPSFVFVLLFATLTILFTVKAQYATFARYVKWETLALLGHIAAGIITRPSRF
jgi:Mn2+/Fe2+ NRAMP family transporter